MKLKFDTLMNHHIRMMQALANCRIGIHNMVHTYKDDAAYISQIQMLIEEVNDFLNVIHTHSHQMQRHRHCRPPSLILDDAEKTESTHRNLNM